MCIDIPDKQRKILAAWLSERVRSRGDIRWVAPETMHVTLKFCGERQSETVELLKKNLDDMPRGGAFSVGAEGVGGFPSLQKARVVWIAITGDIAKLRSLQSKVETAAHRSGIPKETRPYSPHLTLGRRNLFGAVAENVINEINASPLILEPWQVDEIILMRSELHRTGPTYTPLGLFKI